MSSFDYSQAQDTLESELIRAEADDLVNRPPNIESDLIPHFDEIFNSKTQAYREVLIGCALVRHQDKSINIRKPYSKQGKDAYNGRTLDEKVINPFLHQKRIPSSRGPFLSAFRRSVKFDKKTSKGLRDQKGYNSLLALVIYLEKQSSNERLGIFIRYLLYRFLQLRKASEITLSRLSRISLEQYDELIIGLLSTPSGGRFPVIIVEATLKAIKDRFKLDWNIESQGINVSDQASGVVGDITVTCDGKTVLAAEITERTVTQDRVVATFHTKIAPKGIEDYLFFITSKVDEQAKRQARQYFSQGHEVNFLEIKNWILTTLGTIGKEGRQLFNRAIIEKLNPAEIPPSLKVAWNNQIAKITST